MPEPADLEPKGGQRHAVGRHAVIADGSTYDRSEPFAHFRDRFMHAPFELGFDLAQLRLQSFADRLPQHRKPSVTPLLSTDMSKAEEVERFRLPLSALLSVFGRARSELQQTRFLRMQFQAELSHSLDQFCPEPCGVRFQLEPNHDIVCKPHDDHVAVGLLSTPRLGPEIEYVVQIDVGQQRRCTAALGRPFFRPCSFPLLQHAGIQPFLDEPQDAPVRNPVLDQNYPHYKGNFARVIDFQVEYAQSLIDDFSNPARSPHAAISVDMLDTGIDIPEIVNLVFFKMVRSKTKFWQMIGRGTRLRPNLFGFGQDKKYFYIFDYCQNLEFFSQNPEMTVGASGESLSKRLFASRVALIAEFDKLAHAGDEAKQSELRGDVAERLRQEVEQMNVNNFIVRPKRKRGKIQRSERAGNSSVSPRGKLTSRVVSQPPLVLVLSVSARACEPRNYDWSSRSEDRCTNFLQIAS